MATLFINDEQHLVCSKEDFEKLVSKYMGDDALDYLKEHYHNDELIEELEGEIDDLKKAAWENEQESDNDLRLDEALGILEKCWSYLRENYQHKTEIGEEIRDFIDEVNS
ncbi:MAG: hypothetical protein ACK5L6_14250 [Anaerorhabdus sp.]|uniref:hypothetical protein n=1 Tax=Anaerorhabdus sp. TaxID=1872524 RepID=UPI003A84442A